MLSSWLESCSQQDTAWLIRALHLYHSSLVITALTASFDLRCLPGTNWPFIFLQCIHDSKMIQVYDRLCAHGHVFTSSTSLPLSVIPALTKLPQQWRINPLWLLFVHRIYHSDGFGFTVWSPVMDNESDREWSVYSLNYQCQTFSFSEAHRSSLHFFGSLFTLPCLCKCTVSAFDTLNCRFIKPT